MHMHLWCAEGMDWTPNLCPLGLEDSHCDLTPDSSVTKWAAVTVRRHYTPWASWFFLQPAGQTGQRKLGPLGRPLPSPGEVLRAGCQGPCHRQWGGLASLTCRQKPGAGRGSGWAENPTETCGPGGAGSEDGVEGNPGGRGCASPVKDSVVLETGPLLVVGGPPCAGGSQGLCQPLSLTLSWKLGQRDCHPCTWTLLGPSFWVPSTPTGWSLAASPSRCTCQLGASEGSCLWSWGDGMRSLGPQLPLLPPSWFMARGPCPHPLASWLCCHLGVLCGLGWPWGTLW